MGLVPYNVCVHTFSIMTHKNLYNHPLGQIKKKDDSYLEI